MKFIYNNCLKITFLKLCQENFSLILTLPSFINVSSYRSGSESELKTSEMSHKRYFTNEMPDFDVGGQNCCLQREVLRERMMEIINQIETKQPATGKYRDCGLYVGTAGIAYMFLHLSSSPIFINRRDDFLSKGLEYIKTAEKFQNKKAIGDPADLTGFLLGGSGIHAVAACLYKCAGERKAMDISLNQFITVSDQCTPLNFLPYGSDEFLVGRAGYVAGALWVNKMFKNNVVPIEKLVTVCKSMYNSGIEYSKKHRSASPLMYSYYDTEYLGAAHGLSTILQMMISVPNFMQKYPEMVKGVRSAIDFMLSLQTEDGNFPCAMDEIKRKSRPNSEELLHWCHGAPGVVYLMAKAYLVWKDEKYLTSCINCGELIWKKGLLKKGPGICHGVAGNGYVFLMLYRLTGDEKYLYRAERFAEFIFTQQFKTARTPDCPYSLYEGLAGTVCYLNDVLVPDSAVFPFLDIF